MAQRILMLDHRKGDGGGAGRYAINLASLLLQSGFQVDVAFLMAFEGSSLRSDLRALGATVHDMREKELNCDESVSWVDTFVTQHAVDAVHVNWGGTEMRSIIGRFLANTRWRGRRSYTLHLPLESPQSLESWTWRDWIPGTWKRRKRHRIASFFKHFDRVISVSQYNAEESQRIYSLPSSLIRYIPNGVDTERFRPATPSQLADRAGTVTIGTCGRLHPQKRLDILLQAFAALPKTPKLELVIAGRGPEEMALRALAQQLGLEASVRFVGHQTNVADFLRSLDLFVMTSDREGLPYALLEAMACGLPSVVTAVNELPRVVRDATDGMLIPPGNVAACTSAIKQLVADAEMRKALGTNARQRACDEFSQGVWKQRTLACLEELWQSNGR